MAYSKDLQEKIVKAVEKGESKSKVAKRFEVSRSTVLRYMQRYESGEALVKSPPGLPSKLDALGEEILRKQVKEHNDWSLEQHAEAYSKSRGVEVKRSAISKYFKHLNITRKKKHPSQRT